MLPEFYLDILLEYVCHQHFDQQFGKFHLSKNSSAIFLKSITVGFFICILCKFDHIARHTSKIIVDTLILEILKLNAICLNANPVAKYL